MDKVEITDQNQDAIIEKLEDMALFKSLNPPSMAAVLKYAELRRYQAGETIVKREAASDSFFLILEGQVSVFVESEKGDRKLLTTLGPGGGIGEISVLLGKKSTIAAVVKEDVDGLVFSRQLFLNMFGKIPNFGLAVAQDLAARLEEASGQIVLPQFKEGERKTVRRVTDLLPLPFLQRHRVLPVRQNGSQLTVGFVDEPRSEVLDSIYKQLPGMEIVPVRIHADYFNGVLRTRAGVDHWSGPAQAVQGEQRTPKLGPKLNGLLERMVAEGASDLHLAEGERPHWRIDGDLHCIQDATPLGYGELQTLFEPALEGRHRQELQEHHDADFGYSLTGLARFRINLFHDAHGASASIRMIPSQILNVEHLSYAETIKRFCGMNNGLVLVTGPTGSGKSTTLAAMIDYINGQYARHVITLEDPIEYVHQTRRSLINQREVGGHTPSFKRGIRSAMREDPDVLLVGEILDLETMELALDAASTGHLVLSTLHTSSAVATVDRVIDMYPASQHVHVRSSLSEILKGVICQTLCKRVGGGRIAAFELMPVTRPVSTLIREGKSVQISSIMQASKKDGHIQMNDSLAALVRDGKVDFNEALGKAGDPAGLASRLGKPLPAGM